MKRIGTQTGVATVEFALVSLLLFTLLIGIMEIARVMFLFNAANEATRLGARVAVVCKSPSLTSSARIVTNPGLLLRHMRTFLPNVGAGGDYGTVSVEYPAAGASPMMVTVWISGYRISTLIPLYAGIFTLPQMRTSLSAESFLGDATDDSEDPTPQPPHEYSALCAN